MNFKLLSLLWKYLCSLANVELFGDAGEFCTTRSSLVTSVPDLI